MSSVKKMRTLSIIWAFFLIFVFALLTFLGVYFKFSTKDYRNFEQEVAMKTKEYVMEHAENYEGTVRYSLDELIQNHVLESNIVHDKVCDGYVEIVYQDGHHDYQTFLKCGMYKTRGYREL